MRASLPFVAAIALSCGCADARTELALKDPRQVAVVQRTARGGVSRLAAGAADDSDRGALVWRGVDGLPHFSRHGTIDVAYDGIITVHGRPLSGVDDAVLRLPFQLDELTWCQKPLRRCWRPILELEISTPRSNVAWVRSR